MAICVLPRALAARVATISEWTIRLVSQDPRGFRPNVGRSWPVCIDFGRDASAVWHSTGLSLLALWPRGHISGIPGRMITQSTVIRYRTGPVSPLITSQSKFTPIENSQNSCHGGQWTNALFTRYRTPNIPVMAPTLAVVWHLGVPDPAHHSPRLASDCLSHQPSMLIARYPLLTLTMELGKGSCQKAAGTGQSGKPR